MKKFISNTILKFLGFGLRKRQIDVKCESIPEKISMDEFLEKVRLEDLGLSRMYIADNLQSCHFVTRNNTASRS